MKIKTSFESATHQILERDFNVSSQQSIDPSMPDTEHENNIDAESSQSLNIDLSPKELTALSKAVDNALSRQSDVQKTTESKSEPAIKSAMMSKSKSTIIVQVYNASKTNQDCEPSTSKWRVFKTRKYWHISIANENHPYSLFTGSKRADHSWLICVEVQNKEFPNRKIFEEYQAGSSSPYVLSAEEAENIMRKSLDSTVRQGFMITDTLDEACAWVGDHDEVCH